MLFFYFIFQSNIISRNYKIERNEKKKNKKKSSKNVFIKCYFYCRNEHKIRRNCLSL